MRVPLVSRAFRKRRINELLSQLETHETAMRDRLAELMELTTPADPLHIECRRILAALVVDDTEC
jgi:thioredoxin-like negative regulator of GroEL